MHKKCCSFILEKVIIFQKINTWKVALDEKSRQKKSKVKGKILFYLCIVKKNNFMAISVLQTVQYSDT